MDDQQGDGKEGAGGHGMMIAIILVILLLLYVLSIGPVAAVAEKSSLSPSVEGCLLAFYTPLIWCDDHVVPLDFLERWIDLWESWL